MQTVNEILLHSSIDHQIDLQRYSNREVRMMITILNKSDASLLSALNAALERLPPESFTVQRLESLLASVREINAKAYEAVGREQGANLFELVNAEADYHKQLFDNVLPVQVSVASVVPEIVYTAAVARPFQISKGGAVNMAGYLEGLSKNRADMIQNAVKLGYVNGETLDQIVRNIRGTKTQNYADGLLQAPRYHVEGMVRTAINHMSNFTAQRFYESNSSIIKGVVWVSTLDGRTSAVCQSRDGKVYPVDSGPRPPAHISCRSRTAPVTKSWRELGIDIDEMPKGTRASMSGQVAQDLSYNDWLKQQSTERQDDILGQTKAKLFRAGESVDKFVDNKGRELTISQLRERNSALFKKLGL